MYPLTTKIEWIKSQNCLGKVEYIFKPFKLNEFRIYDSCYGYVLNKENNYIGTFSTLQKAKKVVELIMKG